MNILFALSEVANVRHRYAKSEQKTIGYNLTAMTKIFKTAFPTVLLTTTFYVVVAGMAQTQMASVTTKDAVVTGLVSIRNNADDGLTPLHRAAGRGDTRAVKKLLDEGANPLVLDSKMGVSILHKAVYSGNAETVNLILDCGAGALINLGSPSNGDTPIQDALSFMRGNDLSVVKALLDHGANPYLRNRSGATAEETASKLGEIDAVNLLKKYDEKRESQPSKDLMAAIKAERPDPARVAEILRGQKVNLSETDEQGFSPLLWASRQGLTQIVKELLEAGADPNQSDQWMGATSGHKAAYWGHAEVMELLVNHGLSLDALGGYNGYSALMDAVSGNHYDAAKVLVDAGANTEIRGDDNFTALDIAKLNHNKDIEALLMNAESSKHSKLR
jgi:ankyrin repeat protein